MHTAQFSCSDPRQTHLPRADPPGGRTPLNADPAPPQMQTPPVGRNTPQQIPIPFEWQTKKTIYERLFQGPV